MRRERDGNNDNNKKEKLKFRKRKMIIKYVQMIDPLSFVRNSCI